MNDQEAVARTLWGESRNQGEQGMTAVACVIVNRVNAKKWWGKTFHDVCLKPYQFSCWLPSDPNFAKLKAVGLEDAQYRMAWDIAGEAVTGILEDITGGATHYYAMGTPKPKWADGQLPVCTIGKHIFYKLES